MTYKLGFCNHTRTSFPTPPPKKQEKIWSIFRVNSRLEVKCNGKLVLDYSFCEGSCSKLAMWRSNVTRVEFARSDRASKRWRKSGPHQSNLSYLDSSCRDMILILFFMDCEIMQSLIGAL
jgi:hypothetical protein